MQRVICDAPRCFKFAIFRDVGKARKLRLAILQARMSSTRFPGKVLKPILGKPMILHQVERLMRCSEIDRLLVATSTDYSDDELVSQLAENGIEVFRGSLNDVLNRFVLAATAYQPTYVIRLTADCPLVDPKVIDGTVRLTENLNADYGSNCFPRTFPRGLDVEVVKWEVLQEINSLEASKYDREHVTPLIYSNPQRFSIVNFSQSSDESRLRWTVDTPEDFDFVKKIYAELSPEGSNFDQERILELLRQKPKLVHLEPKE